MSKIAMELEIKAKLDAAKREVKELNAELKKMDDVGKQGGTSQLNKSVKETTKSLSGYKKASEGVAEKTVGVTKKQGLFQRSLAVLNQEVNRAAGSLGGLGRVTGGIGTRYMSAVNPITLAAAAVATLTASYIAGEKESSNYRRSVIMTGNAAGQTVSQLQEMAASLNGASSQRQAAKSIQALVGTGMVFNGELQRYAEATTRAQRDLGIAVEETVANFEQLGRSPVQASIALNDRMNYLTLSVIEQIRALEEQGRHQEAATMAMNAYADAVSSRSAQAVANLGTIERAWRGVADAGEAALDALMSIGRDQTLIERGGDLVNQISAIDDKLAFAESKGWGTSREADALREQKKALEFQRELVETRVISDQKSARVQEQQVAIQKEGVRAAESWHQAKAASLSNEERMTKELAEQKRNVEAMQAAGVEVSQDEIDKVNKSIRDRYTPKASGGAPKPDLVANAYQQQELAMITQLLQAQTRLENAQSGIKDSQTAATDALNIWLQTNEQAQHLDEVRVQSLRSLAAEVDATSMALQNAAEDKERAERMASGLQDVQIQWLQATGRAAEASALQIEARFKQLRTDLAAVGDTAGMGMLDSLVKVQTAQVELQELQQRSSQVLTNQRQQEQSIQLRLESGLITEFESRRQILELHRQTAAEIESMLPQMQMLAEVTGSEDAITRVRELTLQMEQLRLQTNEVQLAFEKTFEDQLVQALDGIIDNTKSVMDALNDFLIGMVKDMGKWAARELSMELTSGIRSLLSSGAGAAAGLAEGAADAAGKTAEAAASTAATTSITAMAGSATAGTAALMALAAAATAAAAAQAASGGSSFLKSVAGVAGGFANGGHTGIGGKFDVAGIVHAGEYVMPQSFVNQPGARELLEALHAGGMGALSRFRGYANGGLVVGTGVPTYKPSETSITAGNTTVDNKMDIFLIDDPNRVSEALMTRKGQKAFVLAFKNNKAELEQILNG